MAANVNPAQRPQFVATTDIPFLDKHFAKIAFAISTFILFIFSSMFLFLGGVAGLTLHYSLEPNLTVRDENPIVTVPHAVVAIVGAVASGIRMLPAGAAGGLVFQAIPLIASLAVGSTAYRALKSC